MKKPDRSLYKLIVDRSRKCDKCVFFIRGRCSILNVSGFDCDFEHVFKLKTINKPKPKTKMKKAEQIVINVPEDKVAKQSTEGNKIIIEFVAKEKTFEQYAEAYRKKISGAYAFSGGMITAGDIDDYMKENDPVKWPIEFKYGLLRFIAEDVNGERDEDDDIIDMNVDGNALSDYMSNNNNYLGEIWTKKGAGMAKNMIPVAFFKSLLPFYK
jgi:hypothetical protein